MKNGLRFDILFAKSWLFEVYGIYTQFSNRQQLALTSR